MVKKTLICFTLVFLAVQLISFASALDTDIIVKTLPGYEVQLTTFNPYAETSILNAKYESFIGIADDDGEASFIFTSAKPNFNILLYIKDLDKQTIEKKTYDDEYPTGTDVVLDLRPEWFKKFQEINDAKDGETPVASETNVSVENETVEEVIEINATEENDSATITQFTIFGADGTSVLKVIVYIIGGLVILAIIVIFVLKGMKKMKEKENYGKEEDDSVKKIKIKKLSEMKEERKESMESYNDMIDDAEEKIKAALEAIEKLRK